MYRIAVSDSLLYCSGNRPDTGRRRSTFTGLGVCLQPASHGGALCEHLAAGLPEPVEPKTAKLLDFSGYLIILLMLIRNGIVRESDSLSDSWNYSLDWVTILLFGFLLQFVDKIVRRAVKLKEEQDLTI